MTGRFGTRDPVDLGPMHGIYVLYDRRGELSYIGRSGGENFKNPGIHGRLVHHRWEKHRDFDRYSWFGTLPVTESGTVDISAKPVGGLIDLKSLEALLIYLLNKPKWNRDWGNFTHISRYEQLDTREA
jgi:hypothetical protein